MKKIILIAGLLFFLSCNKDKGKTCTGYFAYIGGLSGGGASGCSNVLYLDDPITGVPAGRIESFAFGCESTSSAYDNVHQNFYVFGAAPSYSLYSGRSGLYVYNFDTKEVGLLGSGVMDTITWPWAYTAIICNSAAGKLYSLSPPYPNSHTDDSVNKIYEVIPGPVFSARLIFVTDTQTKMGAPVIDENTGYIYFFSWPNLIKVNPANGMSSIVATYTDVAPEQLLFNKNDGMFYGINFYVFSATTFIRIDPKNGLVTTISGANNSHSLSYEKCSNLYIMTVDKDRYWVEPSTGKIVKQAKIQYNNGGTYVNIPAL